MNFRVCAMCGRQFLHNRKNRKCCSETCDEEWKVLYQKCRCESERIRKSGRRFSGEVYENPPEKISALKEKYKNGVPQEEVEALVRELEVRR